MNGSASQHGRMNRFESDGDPFIAAVASSSSAATAAASTEAIEEEENPLTIASVILELQNNDALKCLPNIEKLFCKQHHYVTQWRDLESSPAAAFIDVIRSVCRYEASGLQMRGIGLWFISEMLSHCAPQGTVSSGSSGNSSDKNSNNNNSNSNNSSDGAALKLTEAQLNGLTESLLRIAAEQHRGAAVCCASMLRTLITRYAVLPQNIFDIGLSIVETYPTRMNVVNYLALQMLGIECMFGKETPPVSPRAATTTAPTTTTTATTTTAPTTTTATSTAATAAVAAAAATVPVAIAEERVLLPICKFLCAIASTVDHNFKSNYYIERMLIVCGKMLRLLLQRRASESQAEVCFYMLQLFSKLATNHPGVRNGIMTDEEFFEMIVTIARGSSSYNHSNYNNSDSNNSSCFDSPQAVLCRAAALRLFEALAVENQYRIQLRRRLSINEHVRSNMHTSLPGGLTEAAACILRSVWNPEYRALQAALLLHRGATSAAAAANGAATNGATSPVTTANIRTNATAATATSDDTSAAARGEYNSTSLSNILAQLSLYFPALLEVISCLQHLFNVVLIMSEEAVLIRDKKLAVDATAADDDDTEAAVTTTPTNAAAAAADDSFEAAVSNKEAKNDAVLDIGSGSRRFPTGRSMALTIDSSVDGLNDCTWTDPVQASPIKSPFYYVNSILFMMNRQLSLYQLLQAGPLHIKVPTAATATSADAVIDSPAKQLAAAAATVGMDVDFSEDLLKIRALLLLQMLNFSVFQMQDVEVIDSLLMLLQDKQQLSYREIDEDPIDLAFENMSAIIKDHFSHICEPIFNWQSDSDVDLFSSQLDSGEPKYSHDQDNNNDNCNNRSSSRFSTIGAARELSLEDVRAQIIHNNSMLLSRSVDRWSMDTVDNLSRRMLFVYLLMELGGASQLREMITDLGRMNELAWNLLVDDRLGLEEYPGMRRKCYELIAVFEANSVPRCSGQLPNGDADQSEYDSIAAAAANATADQMLGDAAVATAAAALPPTRRRQLSSSHAASFEPPTAVAVGEFLMTALSTRENWDNSVIMSLYQSNEDSSLNATAVAEAATGATASAAEATAVDGEVNVVTTASSSIDPLLAFAQREQGKKMLLSCLSTLMSLGNTDKMVRRKLIASVEGAVKELMRLDPRFGAQGALHIAAMVAEFFTRMEPSGEASIAAVIIKSLSYTMCPEIQYQACNLIYLLGSESPGFVYRCLCRREIENPLMQILRSRTKTVAAVVAARYDAVIASHGKVLLAALKAASVLVRDINLQPSWQPSPWAYHWNQYGSGLAQRPLLDVQLLDVLAEVVKKGPPAKRMQIFAVVCSIGAHLMVNCCDGVLADATRSAADSVAHINQLQKMVTQRMIVLLPVALDFLTSYKKAVRSRTFTRDYPPSKFDFDAAAAYKELTRIEFSSTATAAALAMGESEDADSVDSSQHNVEKSLMGMSVNEEVSDASKDMESNVRGSHIDVRLAESAPSSNSKLSAATTAAATSDGAQPQQQQQQQQEQQSMSPEDRRLRLKSKSLGTRALHKIMKTIKNSKSAQKKLSGEDFNSDDDSDDDSPTTAATAAQKQLGEDGSELAHISTVNFSPAAIEFFTEKVMDLQHALFCMDTMFPLANYLQNIQKFERTPVIACTAFFMSENKRNTHIQRRGFELIKFFAENQIGVSSIALQAPAALIYAATTALADSIEVQCSFCRIVQCVIRLDELAIENFIRFNIHTLLQRMLLQYAEQPELSLLACAVVADCAVQDSYVLMMCQHSALVDALLLLMDTAATAAATNTTNTATAVEGRAQIEGLRALQALSRVPEVLSPKPKQQQQLSTAKVLRQAKKLLQSMLKTSDAAGGGEVALPDGYTRAEIEELLQHPLLAKASCTVS